MTSDTRETTMNKRSWALSEKGIKKQINTTSQAPIPKNKIKNPGLTNSSKNMPNPTKNQTSMGFVSSFPRSMLCPFYKTFTRYLAGAGSSAGVVAAGVVAAGDVS